MWRLTAPRGQAGRVRVLHFPMDVGVVGTVGSGIIVIAAGTVSMVVPVVDASMRAPSIGCAVAGALVPSRHPCRTGMVICPGPRRLILGSSLAYPQAWPRVPVEARPQRHRPPLPHPEAHMSQEQEPHRVLHVAAGRKAARNPPSHWALSTPRSARGGRHWSCCGWYGQVGLLSVLRPLFLPL